MELGVNLIITLAFAGLSFAYLVWRQNSSVNNSQCFFEEKQIRIRNRIYLC